MDETQACFCYVVYICSIHFLCEPLTAGHLPYPFPRANGAKIIRCVSLQSWTFFLSRFKFYSVFSRGKKFSWPCLLELGLFPVISFCTFPQQISIFQSSFWFFITLLIKSSYAIGYSFAKDVCPCPFVIHLQRATVHPCIKLFILFLLYVHKGPRSLFTCLFTNGSDGQDS